MSKRSDTRPERGAKDRGSTMLMAVLILALVTTMGAGLLFLSRTEVQMSQADGNSKRAFYLAEAALEDARTSLFNVNGKLDFGDDLVGVAGTIDPLINFDPATLQPVYDAGGNFTGVTGFGDDTPLRGPVQFRDGWYAAFLTNDAAEPAGATGRQSVVDSNNRVMLTGIGIVPGESTEIVEAVIRKRKLFPQRPPATITLLGPQPLFGSANSLVKDYVGDDCGVPGGLYMPVVGAVGGSATTSIESGIEPNPDYDSGGLTDLDVFADITDINEPTVTQPPDPGWTDCQTLWDMVEDARDLADNECSGNLFCDPATPCGACDPRNTGPDKVTFVDGNYRVQGNLSGSGLLVVTGACELGGNVNWNGLLLVVGEGDFRINGAGTGVISGGIFVADINGPDGSYANACSISGGRCYANADCPAGETCIDGGDNCTGGDNGFESATYDERGGGNSGTVYCTSDLEISNPPRPYDILSFVQR